MKAHTKAYNFGKTKKKHEKKNNKNEVNEKCFHFSC